MAFSIQVSAGTLIFEISTIFVLHHHPRGQHELAVLVDGHLRALGRVGRVVVLQSFAARSSVQLFSYQPRQK